MGGLWGNACSKHVVIVTQVGLDRVGRERAVREMGVGLVAAHAILERLEGGRGVTSTIVHDIIICKVRVIASPADVGDPTLREKVRIVAVGEALLVAVEGEHRRMLYAGHGIAWGEGGDFARAAAVG